MAPAISTSAKIRPRATSGRCSLIAFCTWPITIGTAKAASRVFDNQDRWRPLAGQRLQIRLECNADIHHPAPHEITQIVECTLRLRHANAWLGCQGNHEPLARSCSDHVQKSYMQSKLRAGGADEDGRKDDEDERRENECHRQSCPVPDERKIHHSGRGDHGAESLITCRKRKSSPGSRIRSSRKGTRSDWRNSRMVEVPCTPSVRPLQSNLAFDPLQP